MGAGTQKITEKSYPIWSAVPMSLGRVRDVVVIFKNVLERWLAGGPDPGFRGPVGVSQITGEVAKIGISPVFEVVALLSISLGIVNILPIPALDGGRLMFVLLEWVRRGKRVSPEREGLVHLAGFAILISFMVFMSYRDIVHLLNGDSILR
jgi:regulator of sigma E protease